MASLDILVIAPEEVIAPSSIWFEAVNLSGFGPEGPAANETYDPSFHEITYIWEFDDIGGFDPALNIPDIWDDRNLAYGKRAAHVFRTPGTYQVRLWAVDPEGRTGEVTTTITVENPATAYPGGRTICYDAGGNFSGAPAGAQQVTNVTQTQSALSQLSQSARVLFRRGSDQTLDLSLNAATYNQNVRFGAYGSGARPIIRPPFAGNAFTVGQNAQIKDLVFQELDIRGGWDPTREVGSPVDSPFNVLSRNVHEMTTLVHDCRFSGLKLVDVCTLKERPFTSIMSESVIEDWALYGFFGNRQIDGVVDDSRVALIGTTIRQNIDACKGADTGGFHGIQNQNGPLRYSSVRKFLVRCSYLFSNNSWSIGAQPCVRALSNGDDDASAIFDRLVAEGGSESINLHTNNSRHPWNCLLDKVLVVGTSDSNNAFKIRGGGVTFRNIYIWQPNTPHIGFGAGPGPYFVSDASNSSTENKNTPVALHNVTVLDELSGGNRSFSNLGDDFNYYTEENNLEHAPNKSSPVTGAAPLDISQTFAGFSPRYAGLRRSISRPQNNTDQSISAGAQLAFSYPTVQGASGTLSAGDFNASGDHMMRNLTNGQYFFRSRGDFSISFGGGVTVTNTSGTSWPEGDYRLVLDYTGFVTDPQYASPGAVPLARPTPTSSAYQSAGGTYIGVDDAAFARRPGLSVPGSVPGTSSRGAFEPS